MRGPKKRLTPFGKMVVKALADRDMSRAELAATVGTSPQYMFKVACSRKEASCIIGSLLVELAPVCEKCGGSPDGVLNLQTEAGLSLTGNADVLITGHSIISGKPVRIKLTDYGFEYYGDRAELARVREKRCVYHGGTVSPAKEN